MVYVWSAYFRHRARSRGFDLEVVENIVSLSPERYFDTASHRTVAVGRHRDRLLVVPFETEGDRIIPVTVHATSRQQINFRLRTGRYTPP